MKNLLLAAAFPLTFAFPAYGQVQSEQEVCQLLAPIMLQASDAFASMTSAMVDMDFADVAANFSGEEGTALLLLGQRRDEMMPGLTAFLDQLETVALAMRQCGR